MQPPGRGGRGGNNSRGGFGDGFPGFGDPFAAFGGRPSFMSDMFDNDPFFNDPFFTRPFGSLFGNAGGMFGPAGFFGQNMFPHMGHQSNVRQIPIDERPYNSPPETSRRGVHIEELPDGHDVGGNAGPASNREPIVEHPEDDDPKSTEITRYQPDPPAFRSRTSNTAPNPPSTNTPIRYSYQSSSVTYGGANGPYYAARSSRRCGPDGVYEEQHAAKDMTTGKERQKVLHGLGNKGRALTRKRNAEGREEQFETLHNLEQDEVQKFERTWESQAEKAFPRYKSSSQRLGSGSGTKARAALPSNGGSSSEADSSSGHTPGSGSGLKPGPSSGPKPVPSAGFKSWPSSGSKSRGGAPSNGGASRPKGDLKRSPGES